MSLPDTVAGLLEAHHDGDLMPMLEDAYAQTLELLRTDYLPLYVTVATIAVTVELLIVAALMWGAYRSGRMTDKWRRRLLVALPVAVLFGGIRLLLNPSVLGGLWLAGVTAAWCLILTRPTREPETADA